MMYNDLVLQLFFDPEHAGLSGNENDGLTDHFVDAGQFQRIDFFVEAQSPDAIRSIRYLVKGNPYMVAGAEWMAQAVEKAENGAILTDMTPQFWLDLFEIPKLEKRTAVSLSQAAKILYDMIQSI